MSRWKRVLLKVVALIGVERGFKPSVLPDGTVPFVGMCDVDEVTGMNTHHEFKRADSVKNGYTKFMPKSVLLAKITPCTQNNKTSIVSDDIGGYATTEVYPIHAGSDLNPFFLLFYLRSPGVREELVSSMTGATGRQRVPLSVVEKLQVPLPSMEEQALVVHKISDAFIKIDAAIEKLETELLIETDLFASLLTQLVCSVKGKTVGGNLGDFVDFVGGSQPPKSTFSRSPKDGYVRLIQIRDYKTDKHTVYVSRKQCRRFCIPSDVMIGRYGPPVFQILRGLEGAYNVALMKAIPKSDRLDRDFLFYFLQNSQIQDYIVGLSQRSAGQSGVNKKALEKYEVTFPSVEEQKLIVQKLDLLRVLIAKLEASSEAKSSNFQALKKSILHSAFNGEL